MKTWLSPRASLRARVASRSLMGCWVHEELVREWQWLVYHDAGTSNGSDSPTVKVFWEIIEHRTKCEVCREEHIGSGLLFPPSDAPP
jgi:hypothetical protein